MNTRISFARISGLAIATLSLGACAHMPHLAVTHVPPGQSLNVAMAKKPEVVRLPAPPQPVQSSMVATTQVPAVEPDLPKMDNSAKAAEAYSRGEFCMTAGNDDEAIAAFQEVVKIDPTSTEAWQQLAALYEKKGDNKKAIDAFRRAKKIASQ